ncbi:DNA-3-methyladenine glycosylase 2 family protein [Georgenia sp. TF02-10]|uniref:DNA-3-methyladenine glycosylase family protein n=1 Tax=Georgenia sp. TF02-10 TaxID=2917725 RepID=UPI001FA7184A|nr:DNA-3-methyladenine glycosylase 2 family protein [Georgenia sp. TF02-10]UNX53714.1 DNA-3-methyladenine glycosylase 2 family protein [Georgenia sp. TF02-10]
MTEVLPAAPPAGADRTGWPPAAGRTGWPPAAERTWRPGWPCPVGQVLAVLRHGPADPTFRRDPDGTHWRGVRTPAGTATLRLSVRPHDGEVDAAAWGAGAQWVLDAVPAMLGAADDPDGFPADRHPVVAELHRRFPHWRQPRTGLVLESLVPAVIEQKVTGAEAFAGFRRLVHRFGERAPGPGADRGLWVQPAPATLARIPSWEWLRLPVDPARARTVVAAARLAPSLERTLARPGQADRALRTVPGIGPWTSAEVRARAHGDADAVSFGDYNIPKDIGWALTGRRLDDAGLAELLEPFRPHRYRVQRLVQLAGIHHPRRGHRMPRRTHLPG